MEIVKRFDFSSKLQRMTTISKNRNENYFKAFCKGSPEKLRGLCKPETIPLDFDAILNSYTIKGYRVLAMAAKGLMMDYERSQSIIRDEVEKNMIFLGLLIVKNKLKQKTKESLIKYNNADLRIVMATGDNILTAVSVSRECNLIQKNQEMFSCELEKDDNNKEILRWKRIEDYEDEKDEEQNDQVLNLNASKRKLNQITEEDNKNLEDPTNLNDNDITKESLDDLFPPEKVSAVSISKENADKNAKLENENDLMDYANKKMMNTSRITNKSKDVTVFNIDDDESPQKISKDDNFGISLTGPVFEKICKLNQKYIK